MKSKKLEILYINDINSLNNDILSKKTNHYIKRVLYALRLIFRCNGDNIDDYVELYYYLEDILSNKVLMDLDELKILIYRMTDMVVNIDNYNIKGSSIIMEYSANFIQSLYYELETYNIVDKTDDEKYKNILLNQVKDNVIDFKLLVDILETTTQKEVYDKILYILENNYQSEYATYKARRNYLEW